MAGSSMEIRSDQDVSSDFTNKELEDAINQLKAGKAPGSDKIHHEFVKQQGNKNIQVAMFFLLLVPLQMQSSEEVASSVCHSPTKIKEPKDDPKSYRPITLLCVPFTILECPIHTRLLPVIDPQLPKEQASFRHGRSTADQVTLLTQNIKDILPGRRKGRCHSSGPHCNILH